jgi:hypothetical protein
MHVQQLDPFTVSHALVELEDDLKTESNGDSTSKDLCVRNGYEKQNDFFMDTSGWYPGMEETTGGKLCRSRDSNPRGVYTAHLIPCYFTFHSIPEEEHLSQYTMSTLCSKENEYKQNDKQLFLEGYASNWPDECVRDFQRCYSVKRDEKLFFAQFCKQGWTIEEGVTHIGVDCTADGEAKKKKIEEDKANRLGQDVIFTNYQEDERKRKVELFALIAGIVFVCLLACFGFMCCAYKWAVKPAIMAMEKKKHEDSETMHLVHHGSDTVMTKHQNLRHRAASNEDDKGIV